MKHLVPQIIFLSAEQKDKSDAMNEVMTDVLARHLAATKQTQLWFGCTGSYLGRQEQSFGVITEDLELMLSFADAYNQESVLVRYQDGTCALVFVGSRETVYLGQWKEITEAQALSRDAWTKRGQQYFAAV